MSSHSLYTLMTKAAAIHIQYIWAIQHAFRINLQNVENPRAVLTKMTVVRGFAGSWRFSTEQEPQKTTVTRGLNGNMNCDSWNMKRCNMLCHGLIVWVCPSSNLRAGFASNRAHIVTYALIFHHPWHRPSWRSIFMTCFTFYLNSLKTDLEMCAGRRIVQRCIPESNLFSHSLKKKHIHVGIDFFFSNLKNLL